MREEKLLPCPFCKMVGIYKEDYNNEHFVYCYDCAAEGPHYQKKKEAIEAWNTRHSSGLGVEAVNDFLGRLREINPSNYTDEDVTYLNQWAIKAYDLLKALSAK